MADKKAVTVQSASALSFINIFAYLNLAIAVLSTINAVRQRLATDPDITGDDLVQDTAMVVGAIQSTLPFVHIPVDLVKGIADAVAAVLKNYYPTPAPTV